MMKKLHSFSLHMFFVLALLGLSVAVRAQNQTSVKRAAKEAKVSPDLLPILVNKSVSAPQSVDGLVITNEYVIVGNSIAIEATAVNQDGQALLGELQALGLSEGVAYKGLVFGYLPFDKLEALKDVSSLTYAYPFYKPETNVGAVTSQGDAAMRADVARATYNVTGTGVKVGVMSDSYNNRNGAAAGIASGDLPAGGVQVLTELASGTGSDEGRAMAEIVHDVAPGASIAFSTAFGGQPVFAQGILSLAAAGCNVIVDDVINLFEPFFQDGIVAQAADQVVNNNNVTYFSSAGNQARSSYQAGFVNSGITIPGVDGVAHDFGGGDVYQRVTIPTGGSLRVAFQWDNPFRSVSGGTGATADLDIFFLRNGVVVGAAAADNLNSGEPAELTGTYSNTTGAPLNIDIVIVKFAGTDPTFIKWVNFGSRGIVVEFDTKSGATFGHANSSRAISVGAAAFYDTPAFNSALTTAILEPFSSAGGTPIYFNTAGQRLATPVVRQKPEITCVDGVNTTFFSVDSNRDPDAFPNFFGTSAAAPHAAAVAALMKEKVSSITPATILTVMEQTALDMDDPAFAGFETGFDFGTGFGFIQADRALMAISPAPNAAPTVANAIGPRSATVGQAFSFVIPANTFADPNGDALTLAVSGLPMGLSFSASTSAITGTPSMTGVSTVTVRATDPGSLSVATTFTITVNPMGTMPPVPGAFAIVGATTVSCATVTAGERLLRFNPQYSGLSGQPVSFSVLNELAPTTAPGPYNLRVYTDNPTITLKATQNGTAGEASFVYNWLVDCGAGSPPTPTPGTFAITDVTTVNCATVTAGERNVTFTPQYTGVSGQPISFFVQNETLPTTAPGPYTLRLYTDNPTITLKATQGGTANQASFVYNWLGACNGSSAGGARLGVGLEKGMSLKATVFPNPVGEEFAVGIEGAQGQTVRLQVSDLTGRVVVSQSAAVSTSRQVERVGLAQAGKGLYLLRVSTGSQTITLKVIKQ